MKKLVYLFVVLGLLISCKKETKEYITDGIVSIGKPIGKIGSGVIDIDGNKYRTVIIGNQEWMGENLKVTKYNDGTTIPNIKDYNLTVLKYDTVGGWCYYSNDSTFNAKYGKLYNWYAASPTTNGNKNVCPSGWHVPTDGEWTVLTDFLGGEKVAGGKMKEVGTANWNEPNKGATNISLFNSIPSGFRSSDSYFYDKGDNLYFWSSLNNSKLTSWARALSFGGEYILKDSIYKSTFVSIRCLKD